MNTLEGSSGSSRPPVGEEKAAKDLLKQQLEKFLAENENKGVPAFGIPGTGNAEEVLQSQQVQQILLQVSSDGGLDGPDVVSAPVQKPGGGGEEGSAAAATVVTVANALTRNPDNASLPGDGDHLLGLCFALMVSIMMNMIDASKKSQRSRYEEAKRVYALGLQAAAKVKEQSLILLGTAITGGVLGLGCCVAGLSSGLTSSKSSKSALSDRIAASKLEDTTSATTGLSAVRSGNRAEGSTSEVGTAGVDNSAKKQELNFSADKSDIKASTHQSLSESFRAGGTAGMNLVQGAGESAAKKKEAEKQVMDSERDLQNVWQQDAAERQNKMSDIMHKAQQVANSIVEAQARIIQAASRG